MKIESRREREREQSPHLLIRNKVQLADETPLKQTDLNIEVALDVLLAKFFSGHTMNCLPTKHSPSLSFDPSLQESQSSYRGPPQVRQAALQGSQSRDS